MGPVLNGELVFAGFRPALARIEALGKRAVQNITFPEVGER
jgi:hypothetical protein